MAIRNENGRFSQAIGQVLFAIVFGCLFLLNAACAPRPTDSISSTPPATNDSGLIVTDLKTNKAFIRSGEAVDIQAVIRNSSDESIYNLSIGSAIGEIGAWQVGMDPALTTSTLTVDELKAGEEVVFRDTITLRGNGWFLIGVAGVGDEIILMPQGVEVFIIDTTVSSRNVMITFFFFAILIGIITWLIWWLADLRKGGLNLQVNKPLLVVGLILMAGGLLSFMSLEFLLTRLDSSILSILPVLFVGFFALGWVLTATALRFQGTLWRGALLGITSYILIGILWVIGFNVALGVSVLDIVREPSSLPLALLWPFQMAQVFGLFSLSLD